MTETKAKTKVTKTSKDELMKKHEQMVQFVQNVIGEMENDLKRVKIVLNQLNKFDPENPESLTSTEKENDNVM